MCGIVAVLPVYPEEGHTARPLDLARLERAAPTARQLLALLEGTGVGPEGAVRPAPAAGEVHRLLTDLADLLGAAVTDLSGVDAGYWLVVDDAARTRVRRLGEELESALREVDGWLDRAAGGWDPDGLEGVQQVLRRARDLVWTARFDRAAAAGRVRELAGAGRADGELAGPLDPRAVVGFWAVEVALDAVDRLEVRGRDSAGVHLWVGLDEADRAAVPSGLADRADGLFRSGAVELLPHGVSLVVKTASIVGRLGDNVAAIREQLAADADVQRLLRLPSARVSVLSHTRWASVGRVNAPNAHPLNSLTGNGLTGNGLTGNGLTGNGLTGGRDGAPYAVAALNGDIDNYRQLVRKESLPQLPEITTDAKVIPVMVAQRMAANDGTQGAPAALAACLRLFEGSMAIAVQAQDDPDRLVLGVKGGGQGLYVGLSPFGYIVASEIFGLVARADRYLSLEGLPGVDVQHDGALVVVDRSGAGQLAGVATVGADGVRRPVEAEAVRSTELTTRDVACDGYERYLEKELAEAPVSFRKTLRGRVRDGDGRLRVVLPASSLPERARARLREGGFDQIVVIGQGTAAVAASGVAHLIRSLVGGTSAVTPPTAAASRPAPPTVTAMPASELSAVRLPQDMSRTCVVAISQSGTTTDTNRTVDLTRARGATVIAIVNRRQSDLVAKSHGVLYTGDGRDIEMAVASTKAFYAQIAAGMLLGLAVARELGVLDAEREDGYLRTLVEVPDRLEELQLRKPAIEAVARAVVTRHAYWAVVGSGANRIAASEVRIKLSELCYRGVSADAVEDKKHIDLSAESLILLCAAGAPVTQLADLAKEVAIFAAHRNTPVVIADEGTGGQWPTEYVIEVPAVHPILAWLLSTAAGHLFSYYAARAIDAAAADLREALERLEGLEEVDGHGPRAQLMRERAAEPLGRFVADALGGAVRGVLSSDVAMRVAAAGWYLDGALPADLLLNSMAGSMPSSLAGSMPSSLATSVAASVEQELPVDPLDAVRQVLTDAIEELSRSIDSVKHQAKTVTVGTSRSGAELFDSLLARAVLDLGVMSEALSYSTLQALRGHAGVAARVVGSTRYAIAGAGEERRIRVIGKTGVAAGLTSRAEGGAGLSGSKKLAVDTRSVRLERGRADRRTVLLVPEISGQRVAGLTLLHLELVERAGGEQLLASLEHSGTRLAELRAAVTEQDHDFTPADLERVPVASVLLDPVDEVASALLAAVPVSG